MANIEHGLLNWSEWGLGLGAAPKIISQLRGGLTNQSYLLQAGDRQWVLRDNAKNSVDLGIDRQREMTILQLTSAAGLSPAPIYSDAEYTILVSPFLLPWSAQFHAESLSDDELQQMATTLRCIHGLSGVGIAGLHRLNYLTHAASYLYAISARCGALPAEILELKSCEQQSLELFQQRQTPAVLCHHDPAPAHWRQQQGSLCLIDWEYASLGDAAFDLAVLAQTWQLSEAQIEKLLTGYQDVDMAHFKLAQRANSYIAKLWLYLQENT